MIIGQKNINSDQKLVDVLIKTGKIQKQEAKNWQNLSNLEIEKKLKKELMISSEDIARAYADLYSLPFVSIKGKSISPEVYSAIPQNLAQEFKIVAYELVNNQLKLAIGQPAKLTSNLSNVLEDIQKKKGYNLELAITTAEDIDWALMQYRKPTQISPSGQTPTIVVQDESSSKTIDLKKIEIPLEIINKFPEDIARRYQMVVFESPHPSLIKVAAVDPQDRKVREILDFVREKNDIALEVYQVPAEQIKEVFRFYHPPKEKKEEVKIPISPKPSLKPTVPLAKPPPDVFAPRRFVPKPPLPKIEKPQEKPPSGKEKVPVITSKMPLVQPVAPGENDLDTFLKQEIKDINDLEAIAESANVPQTVAAFIALAAAKRASDIHIEPEEENLRVRYRIDGILRDIIKLPAEQQPAIISRIKILSKLKIDESRIPQDGRFDVTTGNHQIDLRVSTLPTVHGEKAALRILDKSAKIYNLEELGLIGRNLKVLNENIDKPYGVVLSTGPTGSGKTTTLYAILNRISTPQVNIVTLEDPVEYELAGLNQCQIKPKIGFTFANGLRSVLRQDPNIIMVGEIRDAETASLATHAALTGHLVLSTLHTNDAPGALPRLINMGVEPFLITSSMNAIIGQRLVRRLCKKCKKPAHIPEVIQKEIDQELGSFNLSKPYQFFEGKGCQECDQGYRGRLGIFEVLTMSEKIESLAITRRPASEIKTEAIKEGMITMKQDGLIKALKGETTVNEVLRVVTI